ncbi:hypothetical protein PMIN06_003924 [Paraphaeosphaeria minitans]
MSSSSSADRVEQVLKPTTPDSYDSRAYHSQFLFQADTMIGRAVDGGMISRLKHRVGKWVECHWQNAQGCIVARVSQPFAPQVGMSHDEWTALYRISCALQAAIVDCSSVASNGLKFA